VSSSNTWYHITNGGTNLWTLDEGVGMSETGDTFVLDHDGGYTGHMTVGISGPNGEDFFVRCYNVTQGIQMGYIIGVTTTGSNNYQNISLPLYLEDVDAGDVIRFEIKNLSATGDPVVRSAVFFLQWLHR
jgi:hypothetical protein